MLKINLHRSLKVACFSRGTTNTKIAEELGISKQFITNFTRSGSANALILERIANHLNYSLCDFLQLGEGFVGFGEASGEVLSINIPEVKARKVRSLHPQRLRAIDLVVNGCERKEVATLVGVHVSSINLWMRVHNKSGAK